MSLNQQPQVVVRHVWDTTISVHLHDGSDDERHAAVAALDAWWEEVDATFSTFRADSTWSRWNGDAPVPAELVDVLTLSDECHALTDGWFDDRYAGKRDPTGVVKGWAVDRSTEILAAHGVTCAQVNAGGDVRVTGDRTWRLGVTDPRVAGNLLDVVEGRDLCLATSGPAERGAHIRAADDSVLSASVLGPDLARADAVATALVAAGRAVDQVASALDERGYASLVLTRDAVRASPSWRSADR